jgi:hypothetical protein
VKRDYVCGVAVFKFSRTILGDEVDVFISAGYHDTSDLDGYQELPPYFSGSTIDTITEYYDAIDELREQKRKNTSWAI